MVICIDHLDVPQFPDVVKSSLYERKFANNNIKITSITQQTSDDPIGEMARRPFSFFDEYQSKENSIHTFRAMLENARQGFFSGSRAPFDYKAEVTEVHGSRGRKKKRLVTNETGAEIVRKIYDLYLTGYRGRALDIK